MGELKKKRNPGILGWDPEKAKKKPPMTQINCPYCWFAHHVKGIVTRHINEEHWQEQNEKNL
jgi:hypothetical protein